MIFNSFQELSASPMSLYQAGNFHKIETLTEFNAGHSLQKNTTFLL